MKSKIKHTILITGGSGYVGTILTEYFLKQNNIERIILLSRSGNLKSEFLNNQKIVSIKGDIYKDAWESEVEKYNPGVVIHAAWNIKEKYGNRNYNRESNLYGSEKLFNFVENCKSVKKLVYFSSSAVYGTSDNLQNQKIFSVTDKMSEIDHVYTKEKIEVENIIKDKFYNNKNIKTFVLRCVDILDQNSRSSSSGLFKGVVSKFRILPVAKNFTRQFVGEKDFVESVLNYLQDDGEIYKENFNIINLYSKDLIFDREYYGRLINKKLFIVPAIFVRILFFFLWHISRGKIHTPKGSWERYCYPIILK